MEGVAGVDRSLLPLFACKVSMTDTRDQSSELHLSPIKDDFKRIHGIGPVTEKCLHDAGIHTFAQLAQLSTEDINGYLPSLSANRARTKKWILQAQRLTSGREESKPRRKQSEGPTSRQHYENFTLEFLLSEKNKIHRLRITHVQSGDVDTWTNWNAEEISSFLARHTGARLAPPVPYKSARIKKRNTFQPSLSSAESIADVEESASFAQSEQEPALTIAGENTPYAALVKPTQKEATPQIRLLEWKTLLPGSNQNLRNLPQNQKFEVCLTLELSESDIPAISLLDITGRLFAKKIGGGSRQMIGEFQSRVPYSPILNLSIDSNELSQGLYRLEAAIETKAAGTTSSSSEFTALIEGGLFQIY